MTAGIVPCDLQEDRLDYPPTPNSAESGSPPPVKCESDKTTDASWVRKNQKSVANVME